MSRILGATRSSLLTILLISLWFGLAARLGARPPAQDAAKPAGGQEQPEAAAPAALIGDYVGSETCKTCHEDLPSKGFYKNFEDSPHFVTTLDTKVRRGMVARHVTGRAKPTWKAAATRPRFLRLREPQPQSSASAALAVTSTARSTAITGVRCTSRTGWPAPTVTTPIMRKRVSSS